MLGQQLHELEDQGRWKKLQRGVKARDVKPGLVTGVCTVQLRLY